MSPRAGPPRLPFRAILHGTASHLAVAGLATLAIAWLVTGLVLVRTQPAGGAFFDSAGLLIHYEIIGGSAPVVLIHGFGARSWLRWRKSAGTIARLSVSS